MKTLAKNLLRVSAVILLELCKVACFSLLVRNCIFFHALDGCVYRTARIACSKMDCAVRALDQQLLYDSSKKVGEDSVVELCGDELIEV